MSYETEFNTIRARFHDNVVANIAGVDPQVAAVITTSVSSVDNSFNDTTETLSVFTKSQTILVSGFTEAANNGLFTIKSVTADKIIVTDALTTEAAGDTITISSAFPVQYDNVSENAFVKPDDSKWARFHIMAGQGAQLTLGATKDHRFPGVAVVQIFIPQGQGDKEAHEIADVIKTYFMSTSDSGVTYRTPYELPGRSDTDTGEWQVNVNIPFYFDEIV